MEPRTPKHSPETKAKALRLLSKGLKPGQVAKELKISPLAVAAWRGEAQRKEGRKPPDKEITLPSSAVVVKSVPDPGEGVGVPSGSGAGGAAGARAAAGPSETDGAPPPGSGAGTAPAPPQADPFAGVSPVEMLIMCAKFATGKIAYIQCLMNDVDWDPAWGEWTEKEEAEIRLAAPGAAMALAEYLITYGKWIPLVLFLSGLWTIASVRVAKIKKLAPKKKRRTHTDRHTHRHTDEEEPEEEEEEDPQDDVVRYPPTPNGDVPERARRGFDQVVGASFWGSKEAMQRDRGPK